MKASRITAVGLVAATAVWILSGYLIPHESGESKAALQVGETKAEKTETKDTASESTATESTTKEVKPDKADKSDKAEKKARKKAD